MTQRELFGKHSEPVTPIAAPPEDRQRLGGQNAAILERLRKGPASNAELAALSLKYTARISDLRAAGHRIASRRVSGGTFVYTLLGGS